MTCLRASFAALFGRDAFESLFGRKAIVDSLVKVTIRLRESA
jgi:hypothetical protein